MSSADRGSLLLCKTSLGNRVLPWCLRWKKTLTPPHPPQSKDLSGSLSQFVLDIKKNSGRILDSVPGSLVLSARSPLWISLSSPINWGQSLGIVSASSTSQEDGVTPVRPLLWNGFERHLGRTGLCSQWLTYINSFCLPDNPMGPVLLLSHFCPYKNWSAREAKGLGPSSRRQWGKLGLKQKAVGVQRLCS